MAYDLEEQEQLEELKAWWKRYGNTVQWVVLIALIIAAGFQGWKYYQYRQNSQASVLYESLQRLSVADTKSVRAVSAQIMDKYGDTPYASRAALLAAQTNYVAKDKKSATAQLEWVMGHGNDEGMHTIAMLQLAGLKYEDKQYDAALKLLQTKHDPAFDGLIADLQGDILVAQGKTAEAKKAYQDALTKLEPKNSFRKYTEQKLDGLGS
ncbi:MAG TPA: tetratricopeptide repeat protein [Methylophilaceae bacterium]|jgi:predicted negative regulator of RcsB-dependent stress response